MMLRPSRLYIKIFLSFLAVLLVTELLILILFLATTGRMIRERFEDYTKSKLVVARSFLAENSRSGAQSDLVEALKFLGTQYDARLWLIDDRGRILAQSFSGPPPPEPDRGTEIASGDLRLVRTWNRKGLGPAYFAETALNLWPDRPVVLRAVFQEPKPVRSRGAFGLGLLVIGLAVALLVYPVSRHITRPLRDLRRSALRIADGDLAHRVHLKSRDELGDLGRSFSHMAERVEAMVRGGRELTANVSHEIRTPLARIRMATELLHEKLSGSLSGRHLEYLEGIHDDIEEMDRFLGRMLELSKLDLQETPVHPVLFHPDQLIRELLSKFQPVLDNQHISLAARLGVGGAVTADAKDLGSVLLNILDNAFKYTPRGGGLTVTTRLEGTSLIINCENTHQTIPPEALDRVFEPFHRLDRSGSPGAGLGLAISRKMVGRHGGTITASSSENLFKITITWPVSPSRSPADTD
jgi:two-component system sensor histidine kinase CpxA